MSEYPAPEVSVCRDARMAIHDGLKALARHVKRAPDVVETIVDGVVADVQAARLRAADLMQRGDADDNERLMLVAQRYDELIINAQIRLLELGVKAASNEQQSIDRQLHIQAYERLKRAALPVDPPDVTPGELDKLKQRQQLLAAAQSTAKDAEFTQAEPFTAETP